MYPHTAAAAWGYELIILKGNDNMSKLGFGFMRLPLTDPKDGSAVDIPTLTKMVDMYMHPATTILTLHSDIVILQVNLP